MKHSLTPTNYLKMKLDPMGSELDQMLVRGIIIGMLPDFNALHVTYRCDSDQDRINLLRQLSDLLRAEADRLSGTKHLILPSHIKRTGTV